MTGVYTTPHIQALQAKIRESRRMVREMTLVFVIRRDLYMNILDEMNTEYFAVPEHWYAQCFTYQGAIILPDDTTKPILLPGEKIAQMIPCQL